MGQSYEQDVNVKKISHKAKPQEMSPSHQKDLP